MNDIGDFKEFFLEQASHTSKPTSKTVQSMGFCTVGSTFIALSVAEGDHKERRSQVEVL